MSLIKNGFKKVCNTWDLLSEEANTLSKNTRAWADERTQEIQNDLIKNSEKYCQENPLTHQDGSPLKGDAAISARDVHAAEIIKSHTESTDKLKF